jgi:hypothetical protein
MLIGISCTDATEFSGRGLRLYRMISEVTPVIASMN